MNAKSIVGYIGLSLLLPSDLSAQANFRLVNYFPAVGIDAPVFDAQGVPLEGTNYLAELWGGATPEHLAPLVNLRPPERREIVPFGGGGYCYSTAGSLSVIDVLPRGWAWLELRAWDARLGSTYEEVLARGLGGYGESSLFYAQGGDPYDILGLPAWLVGLQSFSLRAVIPEPSTWALLAAGGIALWWTSRRRRPRE